MKQWSKSPSSGEKVKEKKRLFSYVGEALQQWQVILRLNIDPVDNPQHFKS